MTTNTYIQDAIIRHQVYLGRYAGGISNDLRKLIDDLGKDIEQMILADQKPDEILSVTKLRGIQGEIQQAVNRLDVPGNINGHMEELAPQELAYMETLLGRATSAEIVLTAPEAIYAIVTKESMLLHSSTGKLTRATIDELIDIFTSGIPTGINRRIQAGYVDGESVQDMARAVRRMVSGRNARQAEAVVRTIVSHVSTQARRPALLANKDILTGERFIATLDRRTTLICISYDGKIFPVDEGPMLPLHYGERSTRSPEVDPRFGLSGLTGERPEKGAEGPGTVRGDTKYSGWLRRQPADFQDDVLGRERAKLFRAGKVKAENFVDASGKVLTLEELEGAF